MFGLGPLYLAARTVCLRPLRHRRSVVMLGSVAGCWGCPPA